MGGGWGGGATPTSAIQDIVDGKDRGENSLPLSGGWETGLGPGPKGYLKDHCNGGGEQGTLTQLPCPPPHTHTDTHRVGSGQPGRSGRKSEKALPSQSQVLRASSRLTLAMVTDNPPPTQPDQHSCTSSISLHQGKAPSMCWHTGAVENLGLCPHSHPQPLSYAQGSGSPPQRNLKSLVP